MRILVCGGRDYDDLTEMKKILDPYLWQFFIFGDAKGADFLARCIVKSWYKKGCAEEYFKEFKADWTKHGKAAGPIRNKQMLDEGKPDLVIAFPGGAGTANMVKLAEEAGVKVIKIG